MIRHLPCNIKSAIPLIALLMFLSSCGGASPGSSSTAAAKSSTLSSVSSRTPDNGGSPTVTSTTVPDINSLPLRQVMQSLEQAGLVVGKQTVEDNLYVPLGYVITTSPAGGTREPAGFAVNLFVSGGPFQSCRTCAPARFPMPDVIGQTLQQAETTLAENLFSLQTYSFQESSAAPGVVVQSTPPAGEIVALTVGVTLVVSSGSASSPPVSPSTTLPTSPSVSGS